MKVNRGLKDSFKALKISIEEGYHWHKIRRENDAALLGSLCLVGVFFLFAVFVVLKWTNLC